ncbi:hypothetical protein OUZ56_002579 [Daphnia magna]|uniref:Chitin-binding type-2 domain-containing protein n=1 Tax=Daphnia magna TaxID=35525 RepID=A0ABR0A655_9CRUS|nr:hypothetical protein OUZ56_002579 [Daphnia magna]
MKYFPSLFIGVVLLALLQAETVIAAARSRQVSLLSKGLRLYGDSRGAGDIEIGPDPTFICPPNTPVAPHPEKCELYYTCYPGYPVTLWQCYSDYLFDLTYSGCNYPIEVDCGVRNRPVTNAPTTVTTPKTTTAPSSNTVPPNQPTFNCPTPDGFFAIPNTCTGDYYVCVSGSPYVSTCPNGNIFDPATKICTPPANATCTKPVFTCPTPDGFFPIPVLYKSLLNYPKGACSNSFPKHNSNAYNKTHYNDINYNTVNNNDIYDNDANNYDPHNYDPHNHDANNHDANNHDANNHDANNNDASNHDPNNHDTNNHDTNNNNTNHYDANNNDTNHYDANNHYNDTHNTPDNSRTIHLPDVAWLFPCSRCRM